MYAWWRQIRGRPLRLPICEGSSTGAYRVTKQIPGIFIPWFGRQVWLLVPVALERVPVDSRDPHASDKT